LAFRDINIFLPSAVLETNKDETSHYS